MKKLYLCRHGETSWSKSGQHTGRTDLPLTPEGEAQAKLLRKYLQKTKFTKIFASPLKRAQESAQGLELEIDSDLVEWDYGDYEGLTTEQVQEKKRDWNLFQDGAPNGESVADVTLRADRFLQNIEMLEGNIAIFSHGHFLRVLAMRYLGLDTVLGEMFSLSVASLSILGKEHKKPAISLWNDSHYLESLG